MKLLAKTLPREHTLFLSGDWHIGSKACYEKGIGKLIDDVNSTKNGYVCIGGDLIEAICVDDKRFNVDTADNGMLTPIQQCNYVLKYLKQLEGKILFILEGNHEWKHQRIGNLTKDYICAQLDDKNLYGTYSAKLAAKNGKGNIMYKLYYTHGAGTIRSAADDVIRADANIKLSLKRKLKNLASDCVIMATAHNHYLTTALPKHELCVSDDGTQLKQFYTSSAGQNLPYIDPDLRYYASTGSMLKTFVEGHTTYSERFGYRPNILGYVKATIENGQVVYMKGEEV